MQTRSNPSIDLHRRDWRRLWRYCRCGYRWRCPQRHLVSRPAPVPGPTPAPGLVPVPVAVVEPTPEPAYSSPARVRPVNRGPLYPDQRAEVAREVRAAAWLRRKAS
ncbi:hypothetical protein O7627_00065 [Solwaraspora sp. WMMD1047]|uniref:hypothetical protein n=1 Tax=Solwaraspora sp. WMMD1047 TaxID=3016102 RepID=UPI002415DB4C|nr:hypothetical protein [Solwaraspora sp. WMMD1047]MDG4827698.1 hypothetical protein [Solwaraspora sp. WMMD1047]